MAANYDLQGMIELVLSGVYLLNLLFIFTERLAVKNIKKTHQFGVSSTIYDKVQIYFQQDGYN